MKANSLTPVLDPAELYFTSRGIVCGDKLCAGAARAYDGVDLAGETIIRCPYPGGKCSQCGKTRGDTIDKLSRS